jgi:2',3'-cyclic-nucleotide 2'-phosphodiesterase (5'-nucleotidase family)
LHGCEFSHKNLSERNLAVLYHSERNSDETKNNCAALLLSLPLGLRQRCHHIYTNDLHAHVEPYKVPWIADGKRDIGGWANITTMVKQEKAKNNATWFFDAGDYFTGPYISSLTKGKAIIDIMNTMSYDAVTIGNHEFDHGWDNTLLQLSQATFPIVQGNIFYQNSENVLG